MAEMDTSSSDKGGKKKLSTRVDLTPMVDLGFLLITFFMFTTTMSKPKSTELITPEKNEKLTEEDKNKIKESTVITALLGKDHKVYTYRGIGSAENKPEVKILNFGTSENSVRKELQSLYTDVQNAKAQGVLSPKDAATVLIKPDTNSTYKDLMDMIDELTINGITTQAIVDITNVDRDFMTQANAQNTQQ